MANWTCGCGNVNGDKESYCLKCKAFKPWPQWSVTYGPPPSTTIPFEDNRFGDVYPINPASEPIKFL